MDRGIKRSVAAAGGGPPPPKVYRVEPRDFRELVQRLTGAGTPAAAAAPGPAHRRATLKPAMAAESRRAQAAAAVPVAAGAEQFDYAASWFSAPLLSPGYGAPGFGGGGGGHQHQGNTGSLF
jgi:hypothetical protein